MRGGVGGQEERLGRRRAIFLLGCVALSVVTLLIGFRLFPEVFPEASIQFDVDRDESRTAALEFLQELGVGTEGYRHASRFLYSNQSKVFLERTLGLELADSVMSRDLRLWRWAHRWFRPLQKEEVLVSVSTTGEITHFSHLLDEEAPGDSLTRSEARLLAEEFLTGSMDVGLEDLTFLEASTVERPNRRDHSFTWERSGWDVGGGRLRREVEVAGSEIAGYRFYLKVPESWSRSYEKMRSHNEGAAAVASFFYILTALAIVVVFILRLLRRDIRWKPALGLGAVAGIITLLSGLNGFSNSFFTYDTTQAFDAFIVLRVGGILLISLGAAVMIFLLTGGSEPLYRQAYPRKISLGGWFSRRALRTRRFLVSAVLGLTLTCFFFAYQMIFYKIADRFGAWSPAEVPYSELLNTAIPWAFLLLGGFMPAVTEEFIARMFSIPFLTRFLKSRWPALLIPALIWGFGHSNYPTQPFFLRGLEVGLAGILIGIVMLRVNILAPLIWHYTVDALYTGYLLLRSGNTYYILSAAIVGGIFLLPVLYALVSYAVTRRFVSPEPLVNGTLGTAPPRPSSVRPETVPLPPRKVPRGRWASAAAVLLLGIVLVSLPTASLHDAEVVRVTRGEARRAAEEFLETRNVSLDSFRVAVTLEDPLGSHDRAFITKALGQDGARDFLTDHLTPIGWRFRAFQELDEEEWVVGVDPRDGTVFTFRHPIAEGASRVSLQRDEARSLAEEEMARSGARFSHWELAEIQEEARPNRTDYEVIFQTREKAFPELGKGRLRRVFRIQGNAVDSDRTLLKLPENWIRQRETSTILRPLRLGLLILAAAMALGLIFWIILSGHRARLLRWGPCFALGGVVSVLSLVSALNTFPAVMGRYETSIPWNLFVLQLVTVIVLGAVLVGALGVVALAFLQSAFPGFWDAAHRESRRNLRGEAVAGALGLVGLALVLRGLFRALDFAFPMEALAGGIALPAGSSGFLPLLTALFSTMQRALLGVMIFGLAGFLLRRPVLRPWMKPPAAAVLAVVLVPLAARSTGEFLLGLLGALTVVAGSVLALRVFLRDNPWAYVLGIGAVVSLEVAAGLWDGGLTGWRIQAILLLVVSLAPLLAFLWLPGLGGQDPGTASPHRSGEPLVESNGTESRDPVGAAGRVPPWSG